MWRPLTRDDLKPPSVAPTPHNARRDRRPEYGPFKPVKPEYAGKLNFYLSAADDLLRHPDDRSSIPLFLCKAKNRILAEYALRNIATPMGVSEFKQGALPTVEEIEAQLAAVEETVSACTLAD